jgi:hypothetical protein
MQKGQKTGKKCVFLVGFEIKKPFFTQKMASKVR